MLVTHGRIRFDRPVRQWLDQALALPGIELVPLDPEVASHAGELGDTLHGDPADRLIVATTLVRGAKLVTKDLRIRGSGIVQTIW